MIEILAGPGRSVSWPAEVREGKRGWTIAELNAQPEVVVVRAADLRKLDWDALSDVRARILAATSVPGELLVGEGGFGRLPDVTRPVCSYHADDEDEVAKCTELGCPNVATYETQVPQEERESPPAVPADGREFVRFTPPATYGVPADDLVAKVVEVQARMTALDSELRIMRRDANRAHLGGDEARMGGVDHVVKHIQAVLDGNPLFHMDAGLREAELAASEGEEESGFVGKWGIVAAEESYHVASCPRGCEVSGDAIHTAPCPECGSELTITSGPAPPMEGPRPRPPLRVAFASLQARNIAKDKKLTDDDFIGHTQSGVRGYTVDDVWAVVGEMATPDEGA